MGEGITLPAPRLQFRWISGEREGYEWTCVYELILPLREFDIRRERAGGLLSDELSVEISRTHRVCSSIPNDPPFRDGAHARWDAAALGGNLPIITLDPEGRPFVETRIVETGASADNILGLGRRIAPYEPKADQPGVNVKSAGDWIASDSEAARAILNYLGIGDDPSLEPGADRRRDKVAALICDARERDACAIGREQFRTAAKTLASEIGFLSIEDLDAIHSQSEGGFDTPETGPRAQCPAERALGAEATQRLRRIVAGGGLDLRRVSCRCRPGTEGTRACNYGRLCGTLTAGGRDVGEILIGAGLARLYPFGAQVGPANWCGR